MVVVSFGIHSWETPVAMGTASCPFCQKETLMVKKIKKRAFVVYEFPVIPLYYSRWVVCLRCRRNLKYMKFSENLTKKFLNLKFPKKTFKEKLKLMGEPDLDLPVLKNLDKQDPGPKIPSCPGCGGMTQYSKEEDDHYCWNCEEYMGNMAPEMPLCSGCGGVTQYVEEEDDHYCWNCEEYVGNMADG